MSFLVKAMAAPFKVYNAVADEVAKERRLRMSSGGGWGRLFGRASYAGKTVNLDSVLQLSASWACITRTAQAVSCLPGAVFEKQGDDNRVKIDDDPIAEILTGSPNADQTPLEFWELQVAWLLTRGNAYAEKVHTGSRLSALQPMGADNTRPVRKDDGRLVFQFSDRGKVEELPRDKVFHIKGFGQGLVNPDEGLSAISYGVQTFGTAAAVEEAAGKTFANGMRPTGFFMFDQVLNEAQREQANRSLVAPLQGSDKAGGVGILEAGVKWQGVSLNPEDAQMLESRRFSIEDQCRWFGMPPIIIGHSADGQTMWGSGVEQILISWLTLGINPLCMRIEGSVRKQLIRPTGNRRRYYEKNREALLQMDSTAKANFLSSLVQNGLMDRNEGRRKLNLPNREGADQLTAQTNLTPLDQLGAANDGNQARAAFLSWLGLDQKGRTDEQA